jgi:hypothetical protein
MPDGKSDAERFPVSSSRLILLVASTLSLLAGGCSITRKSASIDSISRTPFLGLELAPKRNSPAPETHRIRMDQRDRVDVEPAKLVVNGAAKESSWWQKLTGTEKRSAIPLPRTDQATSTSSSTETPEEPEFW